MKKSLQELRADYEYVQAELTHIHERADGATLDEETSTRFTEGVEFLTTTKEAITEIEDRNKLVAELGQLPAHTETGDGATAAPQRHADKDPFDLSTYARIGTEEFESEARGRATTIVEKHAPRWVSDEWREGVQATVDKARSKNYDAETVLDYIVRTSGPDYLDSFREYVRSQGRDYSGAMRDFHQTRAAMSLTAANGGVLVPQWLDPTIILTNASTQNDIRKFARVEQVTVDQADFVTSAGVTAAILAENTEASDNTPTFVGPTITNYKEAAWMYASYEVLADSGFDQAAPLIADAFDRLEAQLFTTGTGTAQPRGLISALSGSGPSLAGSSGAAGAADFVVADVYACDNGLSPRWRQNASWLANKTIYNTIRQFATANNYHAFWTDFGGGVPAQLLGYPTGYSSDMDSTIVSGSNDDILLLGDMKQYIITDRVGTTIMFEPLVVSGGNGWPMGAAGWFAFKRVGADVATSNAFRLLRV